MIVRIKIEMVTVITIAMIMSSRLMIIALMIKMILSIMMIINNYHNHDDTDNYKTKIVEVTMAVLHPIVEVSTFENRYYSFTYTFSFIDIAHLKTHFPLIAHHRYIFCFRNSALQHRRISITTFSPRQWSRYYICTISYLI